MSKPINTIVPKLSLSRAECAMAMGVGIRMVDQLIAGRRGNGFPVTYVGSKPVMPVDDGCRWLSEQAQKKGGSQ